MTIDPLQPLGEARRRELREPGDDTVTEVERPLDAAERDAVLAAAFARIDAAPAPAPVVPLPTRGVQTRRWALAAIVSVLAAVLVAWFALGSPTDPAAGQLPGYALTRRDGGRSEVRSDPTQAPIEVRVGGGVDWTLTPALPVRVPFDVAIVAADGDRERTAIVTDQVERSEDGAVRLHGPLTRLIALEPGTWRVAIVVAPVGTVPRAADLATIRAGVPAKWQAVELDVKIAPSSS